MGRDSVHPVKKLKQALCHKGARRGPDNYPEEERALTISGSLGGGRKVLEEREKVEEFKAVGAGAERKGDGGAGGCRRTQCMGGGPLHCEPHFCLDFMTFLKIEV